MRLVAATEGLVVPQWHIVFPSMRGEIKPGWNRPPKFWGLFSRPQPLQVLGASPSQRGSVGEPGQVFQGHGCVECFIRVGPDRKNYRGGSPFRFDG